MLELRFEYRSKAFMLNSSFSFPLADCVIVWVYVDVN